MTDKKKNKKVLVKVSELSDEELDAALDAALDELLGPDEEKSEEDQPAKKTMTKRTKSGKSRKHK